MKKHLLLLYLTCLIMGCSSTEEMNTSHPNLLFIFPDQYRVQAMGFMNEDPVFTPNLDELAAESRVFVNAVSNRPLCSPYRGMMMTGKYCFSINMQTNCNTSSRKYGNYLREDETCFGDVLKENGYYCGYIGKWHLDAPRGPDVDDWRVSIWDSYTPPGPQRHGFDFWHAYGCHNEHNNPYYWVQDASVEDTLYPGKWSPEHEADVAIDFIKNADGKQRNSDKPWALFVSMNPPHGPYDQVPEKYHEYYENMTLDFLMNRPNVPEDSRGDRGRRSVRDYFACVTGVDEHIGRILKTLEEVGLDKNTIVVFTSDHGEMMGSHGYMQKVVWYDESLRVPFIVRWPEEIKPGIDSLHMGTPDVLPTFLDLMGLPDQIPDDVEGENYADIFRGESSERPEFALYLSPSYERALSGRRGLRTNRYTFVMNRNNAGETTAYYLYDNKNDPYQLKNIAGEKPELLNEFEDKLLNRLVSINDPWIKFHPETDIY